MTGERAPADETNETAGEITWEQWAEEAHDEPRVCLVEYLPKGARAEQAERVYVLDLPDLDTYICTDVVRNRVWCDGYAGLAEVWGEDLPVQVVPFRADEADEADEREGQEMEGQEPAPC